MRLILAIRAFFAVLFGLVLPEPIVEQLLLQSGRKRPDELPAPEPPVAEKPIAEVPKPVADPARETATREGAAIRAIAVLQSEGRLLDFLSEDIEGYGDADVGAAVREIHRGCRRALSDHFKMSPVRPEAEESTITVPEGYDPSEIRLVGKVVGKPPFRGTLKHRGWRIDEVRLPQIPEGRAAQVVVPAEVELV